MPYLSTRQDRAGLLNANDTSIRKQTEKASIGPGVVADSLDNVIKYVDGEISAKNSRLIDLGAYGIKADGQLNDQGVVVGGTDNANLFMQLRAELAARNPFEQQPHYDFVYPSNYQAGWTGVVASSYAPHFYGLRHLSADLNNCGIISKIADSKKEDNMFQRVPGCGYNGELLQVNTIARGNGLGDNKAYEGTKLYMTTPGIQTVLVGERTLAFIDKTQMLPALYYPGARICPNGDDRALGYPRATRNHELLYIVSCNYTAGTMVVNRPITYEYLSTWPNVGNTEGGLSGPGTVIPLDHPDRRYCQYAKFANGKFLAAHPGARETFGFTAERVILEEITAYKQVTPTECLVSWHSEKCTFPDQMEFDKLLDRVTDKGSYFGGYASNGAGAHFIGLYGTQSATTLQLCAPKMEFIGVKAKSETYTNDPYGTPEVKASENPIGPYPGYQPIEDLLVQNCELVIGNNTDSGINPGQYQQLTVTQVEGEAIVLPWNGGENEIAFQTYKHTKVGMPFFTNTGTKSGVLTGIVFQPSQADNRKGRFLITYSGATPAVNDVFVWNNLMCLRNGGGNKMLTAGKRLFSVETARWNDNREIINAPRQVVINSTDLVGNQQFKVDVNGIFDGFELLINSPQAGGDFRFNINPDTGGKMVAKIALFDRTPRKVDTYGNRYNLASWVSSGAQDTEPGLNQVDMSTLGQFVSRIAVFPNTDAIKAGFRFIAYFRSF